MQQQLGEMGVLQFGSLELRVHGSPVDYGATAPLAAVQ